MNVSVLWSLTLHHPMMKMTDESEHFAIASAMTSRHSEGAVGFLEADHFHEAAVSLAMSTTRRRLLFELDLRYCCSCNFEMLHVAQKFLDCVAVAA